jgi:predicted neuraminidase
MKETVLYLSILLMISATAAGTEVPMEVEEFVFSEAAFASCHASTIEALPDGTLLAAWFGGVEEGDNSVEIWLARKKPGGQWSAPEQMTDFPDAPCWNPVLFRDDRDHVWLFFKVGPSPMAWVSGYMISEDGGRSWGETHFQPAGLLGPIKNKPITLKNGTILAGTSVEAGRTRSPRGVQPYWIWTAWVERSADQGQSWVRHGPIAVPGTNFGVIQPTLWETGSGVIRMLMRATRQIGRICESISKDNGKTWSPARPTSLPNPDSGIDAVKLEDGRVALVYNHTKQGRSPIHLAISLDDGDSWEDPLIIEDGPGEFSYPAVIQADDSNIHITYTWKRQRVKHVVVDPQALPKD